MTVMLGQPWSSPPSSLASLISRFRRDESEKMTLKGCREKGKGAIEMKKMRVRKWKGRE